MCPVLLISLEMASNWNWPMPWFCTSDTSS